MKIIALLLTLSIASPAIAQINRNGGDRVANLGNITATSKADAIKQCNAKGGNLLVHYGGGNYGCHYVQSIVRR